MLENDLVALFNLLNVPGLGPQRINTLIDRYRNCSTVFTLPIDEICQLDGISLHLAKNIKDYHNHHWGEAELERCKRSAVNPVTRWDPDYPLLLKKIPFAPPVLYTRGAGCVQQLDGIAVVGTRKPTPYGSSTAEKVSKSILEMGISVISGLARGIDTIAHRTALEHSGHTIAVLGHGLDRIYPPENRELARRIEKHGCLVTEFSFGTKPDKVNFPLRNRIISGLCHGVVVVEAGDKSGAILTAMNAVDHNREVFAVPGRLTDSQSVGCNRLIKNGAIPYLNADTIRENIKNQLFNPLANRQEKLGIDISEEESNLLQFISAEACSVEEIERKGGIKYSKLLVMLLELELKGLVRQLNGGFYVRV